MKLGLAMVRLTLHMHRFSGSSSSLCSPSWLPSTSGAISMTLVCTASRNLTLAVTGRSSLPVRFWKPWLVTIDWLEMSLYSDQRNWRCSGQENQTRVDKPNLAGSTCGSEQTVSSLRWGTEQIKDAKRC